MSTFDQRGQNVVYQYNAAGNIKFGSVENKFDVVTELHKLQEEVSKAAVSGALDEETAIDVESHIKKAIAQTKKPEPDKKSIIDYLTASKSLLEGLTSASGLITGLTQAIETVSKFF